MTKTVGIARPSCIIRVVGEFDFARGGIVSLWYNEINGLGKREETETYFLGAERPIVAVRLGVVVKDYKREVWIF